MKSFLFLTILMLGNYFSCLSQTKAQPSLVKGLDHIPIAVRNLDSAADCFRKLGFVLKPGTLHGDGISNQHVKFSDGSELELITAVEVTDQLTTEYRQLLAEGEGPAFVGLFSPDLRRLKSNLDALGVNNNYDGGLIDFSAGNYLHSFFFGRRNHSPTDKPANFKHPNTATALIGVWIATDRFNDESEFLKKLNIVTRMQWVNVPNLVKLPVAHLQHGDIVFLPASRQLTPLHEIIGATIRVRSLMAAAEALRKAKIQIPPVVKNGNRKSLFLAPSLTHGTWLEFAQFN